MEWYQTRPATAPQPSVVTSSASLPLPDGCYIGTGHDKMHLGASVLLQGDQGPVVSGGSCGDTVLGLRAPHEVISSPDVLMLSKFLV